jgi:hypothetical protein
VAPTILEGPRETYIEILHQPDRTLVAVLELLLPANKEQPGRTEYLAKRRALLHQKVHLVELDLLVGGRRLEKALPAAITTTWFREVSSGRIAKFTTGLCDKHCPAYLCRCFSRTRTFSSISPVCSPRPTSAVASGGASTIAPLAPFHFGMTTSHG